MYFSITALFTIARTWKQPRHPTTDEWVKQLWYVYMMEYYSTIKRNETESAVVMWMKLEPPYRVKKVRNRKTDTINNTYMWNLEKCY